MKKIFTILLLAFFVLGNFSFAKTEAECKALHMSDIGNTQYDKIISDCMAECPAGITPLSDGTCPPADFNPNGDPVDNAICDDAGGRYHYSSADFLRTCTCPDGSVLNGDTCPEVCAADDPECADNTNPGTTCASLDNERIEVPANGTCPTGYVPDSAGGLSCCNPNPVATGGNTGLADDQTVMGMTIGPKCLLNGQCKFNIYDALGIRTSVRNQGDPTSVGIFVQDIVLSATMFIGTIVTIAIIVSGLMRIMAGASGKDPTKAKSGLINALIGLLIVVSSYLIIRLVQYIAKGF